ncbi:MAG: DUF2971 domain-containing protein [Candidatus Omnitrophica bacterium]|nr:DUF2971 domain-containing protein [Candidatus Omnitrophota bacterium]
MIVCKYINSQGCLDILKNKRLKASDIRLFNDPFEFLPGVDRSPDMSKTFKHIQEDFLPRLNSGVKQVVTDFDGKFIINDFPTMFKRIVENLEPSLIKEIENGIERASKTTRVICFSDPNLVNEPDEILLWSHYADKHRGARVFFDTNDIKVKSTNLFVVEYSVDRMKIDLTDLGMLVSQSEEAYKNTFKTKNISWKYEHEVRWIINILECFQEGEDCYIPLLPNAIRRIDFGCRCENNGILSEIANKEIYNHLKLYEAKIHKSKFCFDYASIR